MAPRAVAGLVVLVVALAGCVESAASQEKSSEASATVALEAGQGIDAGTIRGVVVDDTQLPVAKVAVQLDANATVETSEEGAFEFSNVPVGSHTLSFLKIGYKAVGRKVDVASDEAAEVRVTLEPIPIDRSYHETKKQTGIVFCGVGTRQPGQNQTSAKGNICVLAAQAGQENLDRAQIRWFFKFHNSSGFWSETTWQPSTTFTRGMDLYWTLLLDNGLSTPVIGSGGSPTSPMRARIPIKAVYNQLNNTPTQSCNKVDCMLLSYHYVRGETLGPSAPADVGVAYNQRYDCWVTVFYNGPLPDEFSILPPDK